MLLPVLIGLALLPPAGLQRSRGPVVVVSWDGGADWVIDSMIAQGKLKNVAKLANKGVRAEFATPPFPSKTAVSHFSLFSGTSPSSNGVTGNSVPLLPRYEHTILESRSGFDANSHMTDPLWVIAARAGKTVLALSAAGSYPPTPDLARLNGAKGKYVEFSGFENEAAISPPKVFTSNDVQPDKSWTFKVGDQTFLARLIDDPKDPVKGYDTVRIAGSGDTPVHDLKPVAAGNSTAAWSGPTWVTKGSLGANVYFRLFSLSPDGSNLFLYQRRVTALQGTESAQETRKYSEAYGGFHDDAFFDVYQRGLLGPQMYKGGDGVAERRLLEIVRLDMWFLKRSFRYGLERWQPDLVFHYSPMSDSAGHTWMGYLDPDSPGYSAELAPKLIPYYEQVLELQDEWLGDMVDAAGPNATFCLVSDHGMSGADKYFNVNSVLEKAGLLIRNEAGRIDLAKTQICAPPWGDFFIALNSTDWKEGIVAPRDRESVLRKAEKALLEARDPENGTPIVTKVFWPEEGAGSGMGGLAGGDLYLDFAPGYYPSGRLNSAVVSKVDPMGVHGYWPGRRKMQSIFYLAGPSVQAGLVIPGIRTVDVAPTLCRLMGIAVPERMEGHILGEVFKR